MAALHILPNKTANIIQFYSQILSTETSFYIYDRPVTGINVVACIGA